MRSLLTFGLLLAATPAFAASPYDSCDAAIRAAQKAQHIPARILPAIGRVESGRLDPKTRRYRPWPWTIDVGGQSAFYSTKQEAVAAVAALQAQGIRSIDVGCLQVNLMHHPNAFATLDAAFDPATNAAYGARFLAALHRQTGTWQQAIADYHSQTPALGIPYQQRVLAGLPGWVPLGGTYATPAKPAGPYGVWPPPGSNFAAIPPASYVYGAFTPTASLQRAPKRAGRRMWLRIMPSHHATQVAELPAR